MKRYFGKFASSGDVQTAVDSGALSKPYVAVVGDEVDYNSAEPDYSKMPLTFEILTGGTLNINCGSNGIAYKLNSNEWASSNDSVNLTVSEGDKIQVKTTGTANWNGVVFDSGSNCKYKLYGNINSLISADYLSVNYVGADCFNGLFNGSNCLVDAGDLRLPANMLSHRAYRRMFRRCSYLSKAPAELPATNINGDNVYQEMFNNCSSLNVAPEISSGITGTNQFTFDNMFAGCTVLNYVKCLANITHGGYNWMAGVSATGTFVKKAGVNWPSGVTGIPTGWTVIEE